MFSQVKIDLITHDVVQDEFVLYLVEDGPWPDNESGWRKCLSRIQRRIFDAIDIALDGHLAAKYTESAGKKVRIQIDSPHGIPPRLSELVSRVKQFLEQDQQYRNAIEKSRFIDGLRVVFGHELGRFRNGPMAKDNIP